MNRSVHLLSVYPLLNFFENLSRFVEYDTDDRTEKLIGLLIRGRLDVNESK